MSRDIGYYNRLPGKGVECLGGHVGRSGACIHNFATHLMRAPGAEGASSALGPLPGAIGSYQCLGSIHGEDIELGTHIRTPRNHGLVVGLVPSDAGPEHELVFALLQEGSDIVGHDLRALAPLAYGRSEYGIRDRCAIEIGFVIAQRVDIKQGFSVLLFVAEGLAHQWGRLALFIALQGSDEACVFRPVLVGQHADTEGGRGAPFRCDVVLVPHAYLPIGHATRVQCLALVHDALRCIALDFSAIPQVGLLFIELVG